MTRIRSQIRHAIAPGRLRSEAGLTLLETMIASVIFLFVILSMITAYTFGRISLDREEVKRKATALAQDRLETVRSRYAAATPNQASWDGLIASAVDTTFIVDLTNFTVTSTVTDPFAGNPDAQNKQKEIFVTVSWISKKQDGTDAPRSIMAQTTIARRLPVTP